MILTGDNYGYNGKIVITSNGSTSDKMVAFVSRVQNLGAPPEVDAADALVLDNAKLVVTGNIHLNAKRGLTIRGNSEIEVAEGCTFTLDTRVTLEKGAKLTQSGAGTFHQPPSSLMINIR